MQMLHTTLMALLAFWGVITGILIFLLIYRSALSTHEGDQIFLDSAGESMARSNEILLPKIREDSASRLRRSWLFPRRCLLRAPDCGSGKGSATSNRSKDWAGASSCSVRRGLVPARNAFRV